ncbi:MAG: CotH kinase family protein, partial [Planctomycetes bacterium]|nr:CotH kinase family protein [Planctomycetota bacterium]
MKIGRREAKIIIILFLTAFFTAVSSSQANITDGLIAYWNFDDNVQDQHNSHHGSLVGNPFYVVGKAGLGKALDFDGAGDYVETGQSASVLGIGGNAAKTVTAWVYTRSFNNGGIFEMGDHVDGRDFSLRTLGADNSWRTQFWGGGFDIDFNFSSKNVWVHFALVHTGSTVTIYANGSVVAQQPRTLDTADTKPFRVGIWRTDFFNGLIDDVAIWGRALTAGEVSLLYNGGVGQPLLSQTVGEVTETEGSTVVWEKGETTDSFDVVLIEQPLGDVTVTATPTNNGMDIELIGSTGPGQPVTLIYTSGNWNVSQTITVKALDDQIPETLEVAKIEFVVTASDPDFDDGFIEAVDVSVIDFSGSGCPEGDLSGDCIVGWADYLMLAAQWLDPGCSGFDCADLTGSNGVNMPDYVLLVNNWGQQKSPLVINEFMAANGSSVLDGDGNSSDWVEVVNVTGRTFNLDGWYLTDNPTNLTKWTFHGGQELLPGEYIVVFASGQLTDTYVDPGGSMHTNFKLKADAEYVALVRPDGVTIVSEYGTGGSNYPSQKTDISYGLYNGEERYFAIPTPGAANDGSFVDFVADTSFSVKRGFYDTPFSVAIKTDTLGADIYYTLDGSEPSLTNGTKYSGSILCSTTTLLRAAAFKVGWQPTNVDTQTYIFLDDILTQTTPAGYPTVWGDSKPGDYDMDPEIVNNVPLTDSAGLSFDVKDALLSIPTMSLVLDFEDLFGTNGIYMNTGSEGVAWERPGSVELIYPDGTKGFQVNCGMRVQGGASRLPRKSPKHSMSLRFRDIYGPGELEYPLFEGSSVDHFDSLQLRAMFNNSWIHWTSSQRERGSMIRDQFMRDSLLNMGQEAAGQGTYVHLYLNGMYWGVYNLHERQTAAHYAAYYGGDKDDYDTISKGSAKNGTITDWNALRNQVSNAVSGGITLSEFQAIQAELDVENLIDYIIVNYWADMADWDGNNWRSVGGGPANGLWQLYLWDSERCLENVGQNLTNYTSGHSTTMFQNLRNSAEFRLMVADRLHKHFFNSGALYVDSSNPLWDSANPHRNRPAQTWMKRATELDRAIVGESARWGD